MISLIKAVRSDWKSASVPESFLPGIIRELSIVTMASSFIISKGDWRLPLGMLIVFHFISILAEDSGADK